ncbi:methionine ABC transporter permease [Succinimonas amylolytica]|uniref:methionine ABC transporter permease n=1 Tax=Succinimonas amylolytica TaxID=83769 RepID=UPI00035C8A3D|nr:methionine ABC transporter permease [Succinimonas amylolytica]
MYTLTDQILMGIWETVYMTLGATFFGYVLGMPLGFVLTLCHKKGLRPHPVVYRIVDIITNIGRSLPFVILMVLVIPVTVFIMGKSYGSTAAIVPLVLSAAPFIARLVESSLNEVDRGVIEAAQSMGASLWQIMYRVMLVESRTSLITGATIALSTILGYSAMAGAIGGGGLGAIAIQYGYQRYDVKIMWICVILLIVLVQIFQVAGMYIARKLDRRIV